MVVLFLSFLDPAWSCSSALYITELPVQLGQTAGLVLLKGKVVFSYKSLIMETVSAKLGGVPE